MAVLTGHLLKDPDYILRYHAGELECAGSSWRVVSPFASDRSLPPAPS